MTVAAQKEEPLLKLRKNIMVSMLGNFGRRLQKIHCIKIKILYFVWLRSTEITTTLELVALLIQARVVKIVA